MNALELEMEEDELSEGPRFHFHVDRREFFRVLGGGIAVLAEGEPGQGLPQRSEAVVQSRVIVHFERRILVQRGDHPFGSRLTGTHKRC